ncbi:hypothetical protein FA13DRAFT_1787049 [Coprinellus micaceus]|uniref:Nephrocystin 3-like N-terminal domain-containing protein n=1 Tax=Coprinellus micaceus TaxID=71717 RepID=A0A4Y7TR82_COPMI|nr:hypothetical protein FA13DRAFT_1787049 [Coprinellus micaceus]
MPLYDGAQLQEAMRHRSHSPPSQQPPPAHVEDCSFNHHGDSYYNSHNVHGTANYIGNVTNATLGSNLVTTIERAFFSSGNGELDNSACTRDVSGNGTSTWGSREDTVQYVLKWGKDSESELSLLIHGAAGLGKSTLAHHLTHRLHTADCLAASVSLNALPSDNRGPECVVKLVSREIGEAHPGAIPFILEAIKSCKGAPLVDLVEHFIVEPVRSLDLSRPLIVLFDSVDEWESHAALIKAISSLASSSTPIKFILLGRSDPQAPRFEDVSIRPYPLQPVSTSIMVQYIEKQFDDVKWEYGRRPASWQKVEPPVPEDILDPIVTARRGLGDSEQLATPYYYAIMCLFPDPEGRDLFREYMAATLALQEPLPTADFARLTNLPTRAIDSIQVGLMALQIRKANDGQGTPTVRPARTLFHQSLLDYLESSPTPSHLAFRIPLLDAHDQLAQCCLTVLPHFLSGSHVVDPLGLPHEHSYAVKYLATHIHRGTPCPQAGSTDGSQTARLCKQLEQLGNRVLFRWAVLLVGLVKPRSAIEEVNYMDRVLRPDPELRSFRISCLEVAVRVQPEDTTAWDDLGWVYWEVAKYSQDVDVVNNSRSSDRGAALYSLATSLHTRFELIGNARDPDRSISLHREALHLHPPGHGGRGMSLNNLAVALSSRFAVTDTVTIGDINEVAHLHREALELRPPGDEHRAISLLNLAGTLHFRFEKTKPTADLDEDAPSSRETVALLTHGHSGRALALQSLGMSFGPRSQKTASPTDLDKAVRLQREALELCQPGHVNRALALQALASSLQARFQAAASTADLDDEVQLRREIVDMYPPGLAGRLPALHGLAWPLYSRFQTMASVADLEESIQRIREAVGLCPPGHPDHSDLLNDLAWNLTFRYEDAFETLKNQFVSGGNQWLFDRLVIPAVTTLWTPWQNPFTLSRITLTRLSS